MTTDGLRVEIERLTAGSLSSLRDDWLSIQRQGSPSPYLTFGWLQCWAEAYKPTRVSSVRITEPRGIVALGLLEELSFRRFRFAGLPVTPVRGLISRPEHEQSAWRALLEALRSGIGGERWSALDASGIGAGRQVIPGTTTTLMPWLALELPSSFEAYLGERTPELRRNFRRKLRIADRAGIITSEVGPERISDALETFARLHHERARAKGEVHANIDDRLIALLSRLTTYEEPRLRVTALEQEQNMLGVGLTLDTEAESWFYNVGFDPGAARLSPGFVLRLESIRAAIERGADRCDLGPGDFRYKRDLGGDSCDRIRLEATDPSLAGRIHHVTSLARRRARRVSLLRNGVRAGKKMLGAWRASRVT